MRIANEEIDSAKSLYSFGHVLCFFAALSMAGVSFSVQAGGSQLYNIGTVFFVCCAIAIALAPFAKEPTDVREVVEFDDSSIRRIRAHRCVEEILWSDVCEIGIVTTDEGPFLEDCYWLFNNADQTNGVAIPNGAEGFEMLLLRLQQLPGFDNEAVAQAMGSIVNNRFCVWKRGDELSVGAENSGTT